jgi:hypothetical protein
MLSVPAFALPGRGNHAGAAAEALLSASPVELGVAGSRARIAAGKAPWLAEPGRAAKGRRPLAERRARAVPRCARLPGCAPLPRCAQLPRCARLPGWVPWCPRMARCPVLVRRTQLPACARLSTGALSRGARVGRCALLECARVGRCLRLAERRGVTRHGRLRRGERAAPGRRPVRRGRLVRASLRRAEQPGGRRHALPRVIRRRGPRGLPVAGFPGPWRWRWAIRVGSARESGVTPLGGSTRRSSRGSRGSPWLAGRFRRARRLRRMLTIDRRRRVPEEGSIPARTVHRRTTAEAIVGRGATVGCRPVPIGGARSGVVPAGRTRCRSVRIAEPRRTAGAVPTR